VLLCGDAGGFVNAFTAEGIYYAMVSGDLAARTIAADAAGGPALAERYRRAVDEELGGELRDSVLIQRYFFGDRRRVSRVIAAARTASPITTLVLDLAIGRRTYRQVRWRILARAPWMVAWRLRDRLGSLSA
jgi:flavin-dependent dehydrogenase